MLHYRSDRFWLKGGQDIAAGLPNATFLPLGGQVHCRTPRKIDTIEEIIVSPCSSTRLRDGRTPAV